MTPMNHEKFRGNRSALFFRNPERRHTEGQTDAATLYNYVHCLLTLLLSIATVDDTGANDLNVTAHFDRLNCLYTYFDIYVIHFDVQMVVQTG